MNHDWRQLAYLLNYTGTDLLIFRQSGRPTDALLKAWSSRDHANASIQRLVLHLSSIPRNDVVDIIAHEGADRGTVHFAVDPLVAALAQTQNVATVSSFLRDAPFRDAILLAMDESEAWYTYLSTLKLLGQPGVPELVADLRREWNTTRKNKPSYTVLTRLAANADFANGPLDKFFDQLIALGNDSVQLEVTKARTWHTDKRNALVKQSDTVHDTQRELADWLVRNNIESRMDDVDKLARGLRERGGVKRIQDLRKLNTDQLERCGLTMVQAADVRAVFEK